MIPEASAKLMASDMRVSVTSLAASRRNTKRNGEECGSVCQVGVAG
jgi:hypothetical protein